MNRQPPLPTFEDIRHEEIVNVASVIHRSPFRYPGGKTWLVPHVRRWLSCLPRRPQEFFEPFAGGAIVALTVAAERLAEHVTLVEIDEDIAVTWKTIMSDDANWLAHRIATFELTAESVDAILSRVQVSLRERAFQTILRNRINRGGILAPGAGRLKWGENGKGIASRWYPKTLANRILAIAAMRDRISFIQGDGIEVMRQNSDRTDAVFFIDPPYTAAGKMAGQRLYTHYELDHEELFRVAASLSGDFLMTYENAEGIRQLANNYGFLVQSIAMKNTHHTKMTELLIGRSHAALNPNP